MPRAPKTDAEHARDNTWRADQHGHRVDVEVPLGLPTPPGPLTRRERKHWRRLLALLAQTNSLTPLDSDALYQIAILAAAIDELRTFVAREGQEIAGLLKTRRTAPPATPKARKALTAAIAVHEDRHTVLTNRQRVMQTTLRGYMESCGLTPQARGRLKVPKTTPKTLNPIAAFRKRAGLGA